MARAQNPAPGRDNVLTLRGSNVRIGETRCRSAREPAALDDDVLIDLADDRVRCLANAGVDGRRGAAARAVDQLQLTRRLPLAQQRQRPIRAAVVDDDDLERPAVALREIGVEREPQHASAVQDGNDEGNADRSVASCELPVVE